MELRGARLVAVVTLALLSLVGCAADPPHPSATTDAADAGAALTIEGTYAHVVTEEQLRDAAVTDAHGVAENVGSFLFTFEDGRWRYEQHTDAGGADADASATGSYTMDGDRITIHWSQIHRDNQTSATVAVRPDGALVFSDIEDAWGVEMSVGFFQGSPWTRVEP